MDSHSRSDERIALFLTQPHTEIRICLGVLNWFEFLIDLSSKLILVHINSSSQWFEFSINLSFQLILVPTNLSSHLIWVFNWFEFRLIKESPTFIGWSTSQFLLFCCEQTIKYEPRQTIKSDRREGGGRQEDEIGTYNRKMGHPIKIKTSQQGPKVSFRQKDTNFKLH